MIELVNDFFKTGWEEDLTLPNASVIKCIFDNNFDLQLLPGMAMEGTSPAAICKTSEVSGVGQDDIVTIRGVQYYVSERQPDGSGITTLILKT